MQVEIPARKVSLTRALHAFTMRRVDTAFSKHVT